MFLLLSIIGIFVSSVGTFKFFLWVSDIKTEIHLPPGYTKDYIFVIYDVPDQPIIKISMELHRTRKLNIPKDGFLLTSTKHEDSDLRMMNSQNIFNSVGKLLDRKIHPKLLNKKIFPARNGSLQGQRYFIISIGDNFYNKH